jgi:hypothetical protein
MSMTHAFVVAAIVAAVLFGNAISRPVAGAVLILLTTCVAVLATTGIDPDWSLAALVAVGATATCLWLMISPVADLQHADRWRSLARGIPMIGILVVVAGAYVVGTSLAREGDNWLDLRIVAMNLAWPLLGVIPLLVAAMVLVDAKTAGTGVVPPAVGALCLVFGAVATVPAFQLAGLSVPTALVIALVLWSTIERNPVQTAAGEPERLLVAAGRIEAAERAETDADAAYDGTAKAAVTLRECRERTRAVRASTEKAAGGDPATLLLRLGPKSSWSSNGFEAIRLGMPLILTLVGYFAVTGLRALPSRLAWNATVYLTIAVGAEAFRWLGTAFVFGALYAVLRGRVGVTKATVIAAVWAAVAGLAVILRGWTDTSIDVAWIYPGLQLFIFLVVLSVLYDYETTKLAGGSWRRLLDLYGTHRHSALAAYVLPVGIAAIGLVQQILSGTSLEFATAVLEGAKALTQSPS